MHRVHYGYITQEVEIGADPILKRVSTNWIYHLGHRYAGFLVLLFGAADEDIATWFARSVVQLDSVTGKDVACIIFSKRLRIQTHRFRQICECICGHCLSEFKTPPSGLSEVDAAAIRRGPVVRSQVIGEAATPDTCDTSATCDMFDPDDWLKNAVPSISTSYQYEHPSTMVADDGVVHWNGTSQDVTAVTYATDEIARDLGILNRLPCLVVLDATPDGRLPEQVYSGQHNLVVELAQFERTQIIPLLRRVIHDFTRSQDVRGFHVRLAELEDAQRRLSETWNELHRAKILSRNEGRSANMDVDRNLTVEPKLRKDIEELESTIASIMSRQPPSLIRSFSNVTSPQLMVTPLVTNGRTNVFVSYVHQDAIWLRRLQVHLKPLIRRGICEVWDDTNISPGTDRQHEIRQALDRARVAVLLISADFLASDLIMEDELPSLLNSAAQNGTVIIPLIVGHSLFLTITDLSKFHPINPLDRPLMSMDVNEADETLVRLAGVIMGHLSSDERGMLTRGVA